MRLLCLALLVPYRLTDARAVIDADVAAWNRRRPNDPDLSMVGLAAKYKEFRNVLYYRLAWGNLPGKAFGRLLRVIIRPEPTLYLMTPEIGPGLFILHGFATMVSARRIGANVLIAQQVTIGWTDDAPVIEDDVEIAPGAKVVGGITVGRGAHVGANAVVIRDVAAGETAVGVPAHRR